VQGLNSDPLSEEGGAGEGTSLGTSGREEGEEAQFERGTGAVIGEAA